MAFPNSFRSQAYRCKWEREGIKTWDTMLSMVSYIVHECSKKHLRWRFYNIIQPNAYIWRLNLAWGQLICKAGQVSNQESSIVDHLIIKTFFTINHYLTVESCFPFQWFCYPKSNCSNSWIKYKDAIKEYRTSFSYCLLENYL